MGQNLQHVLDMVERHGPNYVAKPSSWYPCWKFHRLCIVKAGHWEYMGHEFIRVQNVAEALAMVGDGVSLESTAYRYPKWIVRRIRDKMPTKVRDMYLFSTKDAARWAVYFEWKKLAGAVLEIERERNYSLP